jgi:Tol biopolymer transport system component
MPLAPSTRLGPYEILAPLGAGGMGEVYRARDSRLGREVAIKVLPQDVAASPEVRARFEREARTISQLGHPHICTLHDVGRDGGIDYLVMELLAGETLAQRLERGPLPLAELVAIGRQVADALDRAHHAGVVHRDLKPGNIMLTRAGAKLLDFGLARAPGLLPAAGSTSLSPTMSRPLTAEGSIVGTFQYMAPEQLEGKEADARADIWALGCVLHEMATGKRAFTGESQASLIAAIMTAEPRPIGELRPMSPPGLDRVVRRCLQKDPDARLQDAGDLSFTLELVAADPGVAPATASSAARAGTRAGAARRLALILVPSIVAAFFAGRTTAPPAGEGSIRVSTLSQGTRDSEPAVSPDGRMVAFSAVREKGQGLWLMDMASRSEVKLTDQRDGIPRFTSDGGSILFTRAKEGRRSLWRIPVLGGAPRLVLENAADADVAPGGDRITCIVGSTDSAGARSSLVVAKPDGTDAREIYSQGSALLTSPRWSPDGRRIALVTTGSQNTPNSVVVVEVASRRWRVYAAPNGAVLSNPVWDGSADGPLVAEGVGITAVQRGAPGRLFRLDTRSGRYRPLGWLEDFPAIMDLFPDGRLVLSSLVGRQNLMEVASDARDLSGARTLTSGMAIDRQPVYSPDGRSVMFSSNRGGTLDLWEVSVESGEMHRVTDDPADDWDPEYGPDGQSVFWSSGRSGAFEIWTARRDGSAPRQLSRDSLDAENPSVSPDGRWVIYSSAHPSKSGLWRIPAAGGAGELLLRSGTLIPDLSPDGRFVSVITGIGTLEAKLSVLDLAERRTLPSPVPLLPLPGNVQFGRSRISPDGRAVVYLLGREDGWAVLMRRPLAAWAGGVSRPDTLFARSGATIESFGFSPDGRRAVVSVLDWLSGLAIAEGVRGIVPTRRGP